MSFASNVKDELISGQIKQTCCKKAFIYGLLINADLLGDGEIEFSTEHQKTVDEIKTLFLEILKKQLTITTKNRAGNIRYFIKFTSKSAENILLQFSEDNEKGQGFSEILNFRCDNCRAYFLRGAFIAAANVSDPLKSYHLEFTVKNAVTAKKLYELLRDIGYPPKIAKRKSGTGLYYKDSTSNEDILAFIGASTMMFECMNDKIIRDIRNDINRRSNCETVNLARAVNASQEIVNIIKKLEKEGRLEALSDELRETAALRAENTELSLSELAKLFNPPLTKSGLNHRLNKIKEFYYKK